MPGLVLFQATPNGTSSVSNLCKVCVFPQRANPGWLDISSCTGRIFRPVPSLVMALLCLTSFAFSQSPIPRGELSDAERGRKMLEAAEAEAKSASPEVRAYVWMQLALQRGGEGHKDEERRLLRDAFLATLEQPPQSTNTIFWLQQPILRQMMKDLGAQPVEEIFPKTDGPPRAIAVELLVTHYTDEEQFDRALAWLQQAPQAGWYTFNAAMRLMEKLPPSRSDDRRAIFAQVSSFCDGKTVSSAALATMIEKFWRDLPRADVLAAIDRILNEAADAYWQPHPMKQPARSAYEEYREKFLPILRELDPPIADRWEHEPVPHKKPPVIPQPHVVPGLSLPIPAELQSAPVAGNQSARPQPVVVPPPKKPRVVNGCLVSEPWCRQNRIENALRATADHLKKHETELAKASLRRGFRLVEGEWQYDSDPSDPNLAVKSAWPSTVNAQAFAVLATKVSNDYALTLTGGVRDPEIQLMVRVLLARMWLGSRPEFAIPNVLNRDESGCECIPYYMYMPRELFSWSY